MKQVIVGSYYLGNESVQLVLREGLGAEGYLTPERGSIARIKIGADHKRWLMMVTNLLHEAMEIAFVRINCRYEAENSLANAKDSCTIIANHADFSEACARTAEYLDMCLNDMKKAWLKFNKKEKKANGKK